jgi:ABC-type xylose transport system substrate-binding protein
MAKRPKKHQHSDANHEEAKRIALGTQRPGQTKEQTKLITQGIQKGIEQYKKQQNAKARELDKKLKKVNQRPATPDTHETEIEEKLIYRQHWLPWTLLVISWLAMAAYWFTN